MENEKETTEKGSIELDRIDVARASGTQPAQPSDSAKEQPKLRELRKLASLFGKIPNPANLSKLANFPKLVLRNKTFICSFLAGLAVALPVVLYYLIWSDQHNPSDHPAKSIVYVVSSSIGARHYASFKLSVPFKDAQEKDDLMHKLHEIKHLLANSKDHPKVEQPIRKKDLGAMGKYIVKVAHEVTSVPPQELGLEGLSLD